MSKTHTSDPLSVGQGLDCQSSSANLYVHPVLHRCRLASSQANATQPLNFQSGLCCCVARQTKRAQTFLTHAVTNGVRPVIAWVSQKSRHASKLTEDTTQYQSAQVHRWSVTSIAHAFKALTDDVVLFYAGVTRNSILALAALRGYTVIEEPVTVTEAMEVRV